MDKNADIMCHRIVSSIKAASSVNNPPCEVLFIVYDNSASASLALVRYPGIQTSSIHSRNMRLLIISFNLTGRRVNGGVVTNF